jgi:hypothetical protein
MGFTASRVFKGLRAMASGTAVARQAALRLIY